MTTFVGIGGGILGAAAFIHTRRMKALDLRVHYVMRVAAICSAHIENGAPYVLKILTVFRRPRELEGCALILGPYPTRPLMSPSSYSSSVVSGNVVVL